MKKLFLSLAVVFSVAMVSCGGNKEKEEAAEDTMPVEVVEMAAVETVDSTGVDSTQPDTAVAVAVENVAAE